MKRVSLFARLSGLCALAFAQPTLDVLRQHATFFVAHDLSRTGLVVFALGLVVVPAVALFALIEVLAAVSTRLARGAEALVAGVLIAIVLLPLADVLGVRSEVGAVAGGAAVAGAVALAYAGLPSLRFAFAVLAPFAIFAPLLFLTSSGIRPLLADQPVALSGAAIRNPAPVVMVVFDGLRLVELLDEQGDIDAARFPSFARLARTSTWYRNATTVAAFTHEAIPAILTGRYPSSDVESAPSAAAHRESLFTLLGGAYELSVYEPVTAICPAELCGAEQDVAEHFGRRLLTDTAIVWMHVAWPRALRKNLPSLEAKWTGFGDAGPQPKPRAFETALASEDRRSAFLGFVEGLKHEPRSLHFHHTLLPHDPFEYMPSGRANDVPAKRLRKPAEKYTWMNDARAVRFEEKLYVLQLAYVDTLLGRVLDRLATLGMTDASAIVVTADHGFSFVAGRSQRKGAPETFGDIVPIPLFVKTPGQNQGVVSDSQVESIDIVPTLASILGIEIPWRVDGRVIGVGQTPEKKSFHQERGSVPIPPATLAAAQGEALRAKLASVGSGGVAYDVLYDATVPRTRGELAAAIATKPAAFGVEIHDPSKPPPETEVELAPIFVQGSLIGPRAPAPDDRVIVAIDGEVAAVVEPFPSAVSQYYAFEAVLDERVAHAESRAREIFFWDSATRAATRLDAITRADADGGATGTLWRNVWTASDRAFACSRGIRERFAALYAGHSSQPGVAPDTLLASAVADCNAARGGDGAAADAARECGCSELVSAHPSDEGAPAEPLYGDDESRAPDAVWRGSGFARACGGAVAPRFADLSRVLRESHEAMVLAPYEILAAAMRVCALDNASDGAGSKNCHCAGVGVSPEMDATTSTLVHARDPEAVRRALLANHLKRNGLR